MQQVVGPLFVSHSPLGILHQLLPVLQLSLQVATPGDVHGAKSVADVRQLHTSFAIRQAIRHLDNLQINIIAQISNPGKIAMLVV
jgi:hypothetical protein